MAVSINQGYVRRFNLSETTDGVKTFNNLAGGSISTDLSIFSGNTKNTSTIVYKALEPGFSIRNVSTDAGVVVSTAFIFDSISTYGNGDLVNIVAGRKIVDIVYENATDGIIIEFDIEHGIIDTEITATSTLKIFDSSFESGNNYFNNRTFKINSVVDTKKLKVIDTGYKVEFPSSSDSNVAIPLGDFDAGVYSYCLSDLISLPLPLIRSQDYFVAFSNNVNEFKLTTLYSRSILVIPEALAVDNQTLNYPLAFVRKNVVTQENLFNLIKPTFEDDETNEPIYGFNILGSTFTENFDRLESILDSGNFFKSKKYSRSFNNTFAENPIKLEGTLRTIDPDQFVAGTEELFADTSPGVFIVDPNSTVDNVEKLRSFSDNSSPWDLVSGKLEYSAASLVTSQITQQEALNNQTASIGNLIIGDPATPRIITRAVDSSPSSNQIILSGDPGEGVRHLRVGDTVTNAAIPAGTTITDIDVENNTITISNNITGTISGNVEIELVSIVIEGIKDLFRSGSAPEPPPVGTGSTGRYTLLDGSGFVNKFEYKLPVIINGEEYNILLATTET